MTTPTAKTMLEPSEAAMRAAVELEIQMACHTITTRGLALHLDKIAAALRTPAPSVGVDVREGLEPQLTKAQIEQLTNGEVCAELYQVIAAMAGEFGVLDHPDVQRALDNASQAALVHKDLLPWPKQELR